MLAALISAGAGLVGSAIQSIQTSKAAKAQREAEELAYQRRLTAAGKVSSIQQPYADLGLGSANALTSRLGIPTPASANAPGIDWNAYGEANPDVKTNWLRDRPPESVGDINADGVVDAGDSYYDHYQKYGRPEGRQVTQAAAPAAAGPAAAPGGVVPDAGGQPVATPQPGGAQPQNALTMSSTDPGTYGQTANPTAPTPYQPQTFADPGNFSYDVDKWRDSPELKFLLDKSQDQVLASSSATGATQSGAALKALADRAMGVSYGYLDKERGFQAGRFDTERTFDRGIYEKDRQFDYGLTRDARGDYQDDRNYLTQRSDTQTNNLFRTLGVGQNAANTVSAAETGLGNAGATAAQNTGVIQAGAANKQGDIWGNFATETGGILANNVLRTNAASSLIGPNGFDWTKLRF